MYLGLIKESAYAIYNADNLWNEYGKKCLSIK